MRNAPGASLKVVTADYGQSVSQASSELLANIAGNFDSICKAVENVMQSLPADDPCMDQLRCARDATLRGAACARAAIEPDRPKN